MEQIERIEAMEALLRRAKAAVEALSPALEEYARAREDIRALERYYGGEDWNRDFDDDRAGKFPPTLRRGVLSEDGVYDLLTDDRELVERMREIAAEAKPVNQRPRTSAIRRAEERDIPALLKLLVQVDMVHHIGRPDLFKGPATKYTREELSAILRDGARPVFVSVDAADAVQGYAFCVLQEHRGDNIMTDIRTLYIDDLCVDEALRGRGVGRALYEYVLEYAREIGCYNVTLNVWACNGSARRFYEACGMTPQKYGMEKIL